MGIRLTAGPTGSVPDGGATDVRVGGTTLADRVIVAAGGGGGGFASDGGGGAGGYTTGDNGGYYGSGGGSVGSGGGGGSSHIASPATHVSDNIATAAQCDASNNGCIKISW